uniref:S1 RNA-binding domain-containing protein n=1 Tax=Dyadobacter diqingensis TaxID=2938121 RepID=UPI0020C1DEC0
VHVSDLSWTKKIKHPSDFVKVNDELEVVVLELDAENRRLALGHKQLEENPWDTFETIFAIGSVHRSTIVAKGDKFATLELPYGIEGISAVKNLTKEDGSVAEVGESLDFTVLEFLKDEKKIVLTHSKVKPSAPTEDKKEEKAAKPAATQAKSSAGNTESAAKEGEKSTFGDLSVLSALKEQFEDSERKGKKVAKKDDETEE